MNTRTRKIVLLSMLAFALAFVWFRPVDALAQHYVDTGFKRALVTFASARALNGLLSLTQGTTFGVQVGAGVSVQPGAILDPLDDLVEQFSAIMLAATISFAIQHILIALFGTWPVSVALTAALFAQGVFVWCNRVAPLWLRKISIGLLCMSLAVPMVSLASEATYHLVLVDNYNEAQDKIKTAERTDAATTQNEGIVDKLKRVIGSGVDVAAQIADLRSKAASLVEHLIRLSAVFIIQTILLPLFFLWVLFRIYLVYTSVQLPPNVAEHSILRVPTTKNET